MIFSIVHVERVGLPPAVHVRLAEARSRRRGARARRSAGRGPGCRPASCPPISIPASSNSSRTTVSASPLLPARRAPIAGAMRPNNSRTGDGASCPRAPVSTMRLCLTAPAAGQAPRGLGYRGLESEPMPEPAPLPTPDAEPLPAEPAAEPDALPLALPYSVRLVALLGLRTAVGAHRTAPAATATDRAAAGAAAAALDRAAAGALRRGDAATEQGENASRARASSRRTSWKPPRGRNCKRRARRASQRAHPVRTCRSVDERGAAWKSAIVSSAPRDRRSRHVRQRGCYAPRLGGRGRRHADRSSSARDRWRTRRCRDRRRRAGSPRAIGSRTSGSTSSSGAAGWASSTARATRSSAATSRSRCCLVTSWRGRIGASASCARRAPRRRSCTRRSPPCSRSATDGDVPFIAMELRRGPHAARGARPRDADRRPTIVRVAIPIAEASRAPTAPGVVHRDLKPENVMVDDDGQPKILDFGIARIVDPGGAGASGEDRPAPTLATPDGAMIGTPAYVSPEQARGLAVDGRSDVFSFGTMLFEVLCGVPPFKGASAVDVVTAIIRDTPPAPRSVAPRCRSSSSGSSSSASRRIPTIGTRTRPIWRSICAASCGRPRRARCPRRR